MIVTLAEVSGALAAGMMLLLLIWYKPAWAVFAAISITSLVDCLNTSDPGGAASGSGVNIVADDIACFVLLTAGLLLILRYPKSLSRDLAPCLVLLALIALSFGRGLSAFGLKPAGNSARNLCTFVAPAIAIMLLRPVFRLDVARLARWFGWAGSFLCVIAMLRWAGVLPMAQPVITDAQYREVARALSSDFAMVIGQAFIAAIYLLIIDRRRAWWWWAGAGMFCAVTLALQHRSVWTATISGVLWLALRTTRISPARWLALGVAAIVAIGLIMVADSSILNSAGELLSNGVTEAQSNHSTWAWRVEGYTEATERVLDSSATDMLVGPPAGWAVNSGGSFASIHIHSRYVDTLAYYGFLGAFVLLVWCGLLIGRCRRRIRGCRGKQPLVRGSAALLQALLISELVYLVPYFGGLLQGFGLGLIWVAATQRLLEATRRSPAPVFVRAGCAAEPVVLAVQR